MSLYSHGDFCPITSPLGRRRVINRLLCTGEVAVVSSRDASDKALVAFMAGSWVWLCRPSRSTTPAHPAQTGGAEWENGSRGWVREKLDPMQISFRALAMKIQYLDTFPPCPGVWRDIGLCGLGDGQRSRSEHKASCRPGSPKQRAQDMNSTVPLACCRQQSARHHRFPLASSRNDRDQCPQRLLWGSSLSPRSHFNKLHFLLLPLIPQLPLLSKISLKYIISESVVGVNVCFPSRRVCIFFTLGDTFCLWSLCRRLVMSN